jgi:hypothetical protein
MKAGISVRPQIHKLMKDKDFEKTMNAREKEAWTAFRFFTENFLGNNKDPNYKNIVVTMLKISRSWAATWGKISLFTLSYRILSGKSGTF